MKLLALLCIIALVTLRSPLEAQELSYQRYPGQTYYEDSLHVFWTHYPDPFSPRTVGDTTKSFIHGLTFFCDLSDTVQVALVGEHDSLLTSGMVVAQNPPHFSAGYWMAGPQIDRASLPPTCFRAPSDGYVRPLLMVRGRWKSLREFGIPVRKGWYYWIESEKPGKE